MTDLINPNSTLDTIADRVIKLLRDNLSESFAKKFYYGDPVYINLSLLPCIIVERNSTRVLNTGPTGLDELEHELTVKLVTNKLDEIGKQSDEIIMQRQVEAIVEGRDKTTGQYLPQSICGILRTNFTLGNTAQGQEMDITYGVYPRAEESLTNEAWIRFSVHEYVTVSSRV